ncbi:MAG: autotransporter-associated beta strand repeat-containing protein [Verrucomicrobiales bacterium]
MPLHPIPRSALAIFAGCLIQGTGMIESGFGAVWDGGTNGNGNAWITATNWVGDGLPPSGDNLVFDNRNGSPNADLSTPMGVGSSSTFGLITFSDANGRLPSTLNINANITGFVARVITLNTGITLANTTTTVAFNANTNGALSLSLGGNATFTTSLSSQLTLATPISGNFGITKAGTGTLLLSSSSNSYTGTTTINGGTLRLGADDVLPNTNLVLNGGTLNTGGNSDTLGQLELSSTSTIDMTNVGALVFSDSSSLNDNWGGTLSIWNWEPGVTSMRFGTTSAGLTLGQLSQISVYEDGGTTLMGPASLSSNGFLIVVPEPGAVMAGLALLGVIGWRERRHFLRVRGVA